MRVGPSCPSSKNGMSFFFSFISNHTNYLLQSASPANATFDSKSLPLPSSHQCTFDMAETTQWDACLFTSTETSKHWCFHARKWDTLSPNTKHIHVDVCLCSAPFSSVEATTSTCFSCPPSETMVRCLFFYSIHNWTNH
jgi:hypothetical protein